MFIVDGRAHWVAVEPSSNECKNEKKPFVVDEHGVRWYIDRLVGEPDDC